MTSDDQSLFSLQEKNLNLVSESGFDLTKGEKKIELVLTLPFLRLSIFSFLGSQLVTLSFMSLDHQDFFGLCCFIFQLNHTKVH